jgi:hypothetical protein
VITQPTGIASRNCSYEPIECAKRVGAAGAVCRNTYALLKFTQCFVSLSAEPAIHTPCSEAEFVESALKFGHVVTNDQVTGSIGKHSVTELPARFIESSECFWPNNAVDRDPTLLLKTANGKVKVVCEHVTDGLDVPSQVGQPGTYLRDRRTGVAVTQDHGEGALPYR